MSEEKKKPLLARIVGKLWSNVKNFASPRRGAAEIGAYLRGGLKDLQDFMTKPWRDSPQQHEEAGMFASPTPQMVTEGLQGRPVNPRTDKVVPLRQEVKQPSQSEVQAEMDRMRGNEQSRSHGRY